MYKKVVLKTHHGHILIRYVKSNIRLLYRVLDAPTRNEIYDQISQLADEIEQEMPKLFYRIFDINQQFYAVVLIEADNLNNMPIQKLLKTLENTTKRIAQWYSYGYLIPLLENREPFTNDYEDENDDE
jgi:hypothetical protein